MLEILYHTVFLLFTVYILAESIYYAINEIKNNNNKFGGISVIVFASFCVIFSNLIVFLK